MPKKTLIAVFIALALIIVGCRVRDASDEDSIGPTLKSDVQLVNATNTPADDAPTQEVLVTNTPSATVFTLPTETSTLAETNVPAFPSATPEQALGSSPTGAALQPSNTVPPLPSDTPTQFPTDTPSLTPTPSITPSPTVTFTSTPASTETFTPFPSLTPTPSAQIVAQEPSPNQQQQTATAIILTFEASQGTIYPTATTFDGGQQPGATQPPVVEGPTQLPPGFLPDCEYYIEPGDRLGNIAITYNMTVETLANYNNITNPNFIEAGDTIMIPGCGRNPTATPTVTPDPTNAPEYNNSTGPIQYEVQAGDNIYRLSVRYGVTMREILVANPGITDINSIFVGETLTIPTRSQFETDTTTTPAPTTQSVPAFPTATLG